MAGGLVQRRSVVLAKIESPYGTASPAGADAIQVRDFNVPALQVEMHERMKSDSSLAPDRQVHGARHYTYAFKTELKAHGSVATTAPETSPLLKSIGMAENLVTDVTYTPSSSFKLGTSLWVYQDGKLYKLNGGVGNVNFTWEAGGPFDAEWEFTGLYNAESDAAFPGSITHDAELPDPALGVSLTIGGYTVIVKSFSLSPNNIITARKDGNAATGYAGFQITGRNWSGSLTVEDDLVATKAWVALALAGTEQAITFTTGTGTGSKVTITIPKAQILVPEAGEDGGIMTKTLAFECKENAAVDDEVDITFS